MCAELANTNNDNRAVQLFCLCQLLPVVYQDCRATPWVGEGAKHSKKKAADVSRLWGPKHQEAFRSLKGVLTAVPVLATLTTPSPSSWSWMPAMTGSAPSCTRNRVGSQECFPLPAGTFGPMRKTVHSTAACSWSFSP